MSQKFLCERHNLQKQAPTTSSPLIGSDKTGILDPSYELMEKSLRDIFSAKNWIPKRMTLTFRNLHTDKTIQFGLIDFSSFSNPLGKFN